MHVYGYEQQTAATWDFLETTRICTTNGVESMHAVAGSAAAGRPRAVAILALNLCSLLNNGTHNLLGGSYHVPIGRHNVSPGRLHQSQILHIRLCTLSHE